MIDSTREPDLVRLLADLEGRLYAQERLSGAAGGSSTVTGPVHITVKNTSGGALTAGTAVYATGSVGASGAVEVGVCDNTNTATMPALGLLDGDLANNGEGSATILGIIDQIDTSGWAINDELWVNGAGALTNVRPTSGLIQKIGRVVRVNASTGEVLVLGAGRTNDVPLPLFVDHANQRVGIGTVTPDQELHVEGGIKYKTINGGDGHLQWTNGSNYLTTTTTASTLFRTYDGSVYDTWAAFDGTNKRLGVGTFTPSVDLEVVGNSQVQINVSDATYPKIGNYYSSSDNLEIGSFGGIDFAIDTVNNTSEVFNWRSGGSAGAGSLLMQLNEAAELSIGGNGSVAGAHLHVHSRNRAVSVMDSSWDNYAELGYTSQGSTSPAYGLLTGYSLFFKTGTTRGGLADRMYISSGGQVAINGTSLQSGYELTVNGDTYQSGACKALLHDSNGNNSRDKLRVWNSSSYSIGMSSGFTYGYLSDYAMTFQMSNSNNRGWWWGDTNHTNSQGAMSLSTQGMLCVATRISVGQGESVTSPNSSYNFYNNGTSYLNGSVHSPGIYNLTTGTTSNLVHASSGTYGYKLYRSTSSLRSKTDVETLDDHFADLMLQSRPVWYRSSIEHDDQQWSWIGLIAEEQAELDPRLATWEVDPEWEGDEFEHMSEYPAEALRVSGVPYERLAVPLLSLCQRQQSELDELRARIEALEN